MFTPLEIMAAMVEVGHYNFSTEIADPDCYLALWGGAYSGWSVEIEMGESAVFYAQKRGYLTVEMDLEYSEAKQVIVDLASFCTRPGDWRYSEYNRMQKDLLRGPAGQGADGPIYQISAPANWVARWVAEQVLQGKSVEMARGKVFCP